MMWKNVKDYEGDNSIFTGIVGDTEGKPMFVTTIGIVGRWEDVKVGDIFVAGKLSNLTPVRIQSIKYDKKRNITSIFGEDLRFAK